MTLLISVCSSTDRCPTQFQSPIVVCASRDLHINSGCQKKIPFVEMVTLTLVLDFEDLRDPAMVMDGLSSE
jgi:hypothetical protein